MSAEPDDFDVATRYLRGELDEIDRAVFEERLLADDEVHRLVRAAEDELLDAHAAGTLDAATRARLDARLAAEPELRRRRVLAGGLRRRAARPAAAAGATVTPIGPRRRVMRWAAPAIVALAAAALVLFYLSRSPALPAPEIVTIAMAAPTRGSEVPEVKLVAGTRTLRVVLDVPLAPPPAVTVTGPRGPVKHTVGAPTPDGLPIDLDAAAVVPGLHDLTVHAAGAPAVTFQLRVAR